MSTENTVISFPVRIWQILWYSLIAIVGSIGNGLVLYVGFSKKKGGINRRAPFNIYLMTLAIVDLLISLFCIPNYLLSTEIFSHPGGALGKWLCKFVTSYFLPFWMMNISAFLLVAIALERRRVVIQPFANLQETRISRSLSVVCGVVMLSIITQTPTIYGFHYVERNSSIGKSCVYLYDNVPMQIMHYNSLLLECVIPLIIFVVCFYQMHKRLYADSSLYKDKVNNNPMKRTKQTVNTMRLVVIAFVLCVSLNEVFFVVLKPVLNVTSIQWNSQIYQFTVMMRFTNSCINPILYGLKSQVFRKRLKETLCIVSSSKRRSSHDHRATIKRSSTPYGKILKTPSDIV